MQARLDEKGVAVGKAAGCAGAAEVLDIKVRVEGKRAVGKAAGR